MTRDWYPGVWDIPGGHVEEGERDWNALVRELAEELGVEVHEPEFAPVARLKARGRGKATIDLAVWVVDSWQGEVRNSLPMSTISLNGSGGPNSPTCTSGTTLSRTPVRLARRVLNHRERGSQVWEARP